MLGLIFKIFGDSRPWQHEIDKMQLGAEKAGKKIANKFNLGYAGMIVAAVTTAQRAISQSIASGTEAIQASAGLKTAVEDFAQLKYLAEQAGVPVEKLAETLKNGGVHAEQLKRILEETKDVTRGGFSRETSGWLALLGRTGTKGWNGIKNVFGHLSAWGAWMLAKRVDTSMIGQALGTSFSTMGEETAGEIESQKGEAALAVKRAEREAMRKRLFEEGQAQAQADVFKMSRDYYDKRQKRILDLMPDRGTADALTRVGIGNFGTAAESRNYQRDSLELFKKIEKNTSDGRTMKGFEDLLKTY